jgi:putative colanic acid biosynthesis UDP-glucose lipid carrier transferase
MIYKNRVNYYFRLFIDLIVMAIAYLISYHLIRSIYNFTIPSSSLLNIFLASAVIWYINGRVFQLYNEITFISYSQELISLLKASILHLLFLTFVLFLLYDNIDLFRAFIFLYNFSLFFLLVLQKYIYRLYQGGIIKMSKPLKNVLVIGPEIYKTNVFRSMLSNNSLDFKIVGALFDEENNDNIKDYLGKITELEKVLISLNVDEVMISLPKNKIDEIEYVNEICESKGLRVTYLSSEFNLYDVGAIKITNYAGFPLVMIRYYPLDERENRFFKRIFDILFSLSFLIFIFSWAFPLIAIAVKLSSKGPIFFKQSRWGINNKKIICYKFRTMYVDNINNGINFIQVTKNDPRVTPVGRFLRRTSFDEFPQFFHVLIGSMSIVGPRPHAIKQNLESRDIIKNYMLRHLVKPGITGWAQVNGSRGEIKDNSDMQKRINFDLWYIENWNLWLDLQIILQTTINLIKGDENAY